MDIHYLTYIGAAKERERVASLIADETRGRSSDDILGHIEAVGENTLKINLGDRPPHLMSALNKLFGIPSTYDGGKPDPEMERIRDRAVQHIQGTPGRCFFPGDVEFEDGPHTRLRGISTFEASGNIIGRPERVREVNEGVPVPQARAGQEHAGAALTRQGELGTRAGGPNENLKSREALAGATERDQQARAP